MFPPLRMIHGPDPRLETTVKILREFLEQQLLMISSLKVTAPLFFYLLLFTTSLKIPVFISGNLIKLLSFDQPLEFQNLDKLK